MMALGHQLLGQRCDASGEDAVLAPLHATLSRRDSMRVDLVGYTGVK